MAYYRSIGSIPPKRHTQHRTPQGGLYSEELMGEEGFSSDSSLLYHRGIPSAITAAEVWELPSQATTPNHPLKPRHLRRCPPAHRRLCLRLPHPPRRKFASIVGLCLKPSPCSESHRPTCPGAPFLTQRPSWQITKAAVSSAVCAVAAVMAMAARLWPRKAVAAGLDVAITMPLHFQPCPPIRCRWMMIPFCRPPLCLPPA